MQGVGRPLDGTVWEVLSGLLLDSFIPTRQGEDMDLYELIAQGESLTVEFKSDHGPFARWNVSRNKR